LGLKGFVVVVAAAKFIFHIFNGIVLGFKSISKIVKSMLLISSKFIFYRL